jgi:hypothetical protein
MKKLRKWLLLLATLLFPLIVIESPVRAYVPESVNVTVTSEMHIMFDETNPMTTLTYEADNHMQSPIWISNICIESYQGWVLSPKGSVLGSDEKNILLSLGEQYLFMGENPIDNMVPMENSKTIMFQVERGEWTHEVETKEAIVFVVDYEVGRKQFRLSFETSEEDCEMDSYQAYNGDEFALPIPTREKHKFIGWMDEEGNLFKDTYQMPPRNVTLEAMWEWTNAYAIYCENDASLMFVRSEDPIQEGSRYGGKTVTRVYEGIETEAYEAFQTPWMEERELIRTIRVKDCISPISTAYWFSGMGNVCYVDVAKLDMSQVTDMNSMFSDLGNNVNDTVQIRGLSNWDTSNVQQMEATFRCTGKSAKEFRLDNISEWNTTSANNMWQMFADTAMLAAWEVDLSGWDVENVTRYEEFNRNSEEKVLMPLWLN